METFVKWTIVVMIVIGVLSTITIVGKPRRPLTGGTAAAVALVNLSIAAAIVAYWD